MYELIGALGLGLQTALSLTNLTFCFLGVLLGMIFGVLPGIGALTALAMLFPITFRLDPTAAVIMMGGIYYGTAYGGAISAILLNVPGTPSTAVAVLDGHPLAKNGRAGVALLTTAVSSFSGGSVGILVTMFFAPLIAAFAIKFQAPEYFSLMVLGLIAASTISQSSAVKGIAMVVLGIIFGLVGMDINSGVERFTFGSLDLVDGISIVAIAMGLFGIPEVIASTGRGGAARVNRVSLRPMLPTRQEVKQIIAPILRGASIGSFFGTLPGAGGTVASFMSYSVEKRVAKDPSRFGKGALEGVAGPEAANNAADQTAFVPTLTLGIPGSATMAIILGILLINGIIPGPRLISEEPELFWGVIMSFWVGNALLLILNIPLIGVWVRILQIPYRYLYPAILIFVAVGVFSVHNNIFDIWMVIMFGLIGHVMQYFGLPAAPALLGFILGPMLEENFRRAMLISRGDPSIFIQTPMSALFLSVAAILLVWGVVSAVTQRKRAQVVTNG